MPLIKHSSDLVAYRKLTMGSRIFPVGAISLQAIRVEGYMVPTELTFSKILLGK